MTEITAYIRPIGYERDLSKVWAAFTKGCGGVIVDGSVPESVQAEIARPLPDDEFYMECRNADIQNIVWRDEWGPILLPETERWLAEEIRQVIKAGIGWEREDRIKRGHLMTVWADAALDRGWHTDVPRVSNRPDVHMHIGGGGMVLASPRLSRPYLNSIDLDMDRGWEGNVLEVHEPDQFLQDMGFELIELQPGQKLFFKQHCLHRSAPVQAGKVKVRGVMF